MTPRRFSRYVPDVVATVVFVLAFVLLALSVFFVAMSGGGRGARDSLQTQKKGGRRLVTVSIFVLIAALGVGIPAVVLGFNANKQSRQAPGGLVLTHRQQHGRQVFARNCATCHTLAAANAVGKVGPNLDILRPPYALTMNAIKLGRARGNGAMPALLVTGQDAKDVASFIAVAAGR